VNVPFGFATCGWRLGTRDDSLWMDKHTPGDWAASSINTGLGRDPVEKAYGAMPSRPKWVIGWAEDDGCRRGALLHQLGSAALGGADVRELRASRSLWV